MSSNSDTAVQRQAQPIILGILAERLGIAGGFDEDVAIKDSVSDAGANIDGVSKDGKVLVEVWAHQGDAIGAQKDKLLRDA